MFVTKVDLVPSSGFFSYLQNPIDTAMTTDKRLNDM